VQTSRDDYTENQTGDVQKVFFIRRIFETESFLCKQENFLVRNPILLSGNVSVRVMWQAFVELHLMLKCSVFLALWTLM